MPDTTVIWDDQSKFYHDILFRFEKAFGEGTNPDVADFLQGEGLSRWRLLTELLHSDLELRLRAGQDIRVQAYLKRFPELANLPNELAALVTTEIRVLQQLGKEVLQREYESEYGSVLASRIRSIFKSAGMALPDIPGYEVLDVIGQGGMGQVYRARHLQLQRDVAIKVIRPDKVNTDLDAERYKARFRKEASSVAGVNHPHVVQIYEIGEQDGTLFLAMEFVEGNSLQKHIDEQGVLSPRAAAEMFVKIAEGVQAVHQQQIIHRDLKPDNILLTKNGEPKITDFGLARPIERDVQETQPGDVVGTPVYMSPEQASLGDEKITPLVDVYGLGATLYCALTGRAPFPRESLKVTLQKVLKEEVVPIRRLRHEVPVDLETICLKCLAKEPRQRYESAKAMEEDLKAFLDGRPVKARPLSFWGKSYRWVKRHPWAAALVLLSIASLIIITVLATDAVRETHLRKLAEAAKVSETYRSEISLANEQGNTAFVIEKFQQAAERQVDLPAAIHLTYVDAQLARYNTVAAKSALQDLKNKSMPKEILGRVALLEGTYLMGEDEAKAILLINQAIKNGLSQADEFYAKALLNPEPLKALELYQKALERDSRHLQARSMTSILLVILGRHQDAIDMAKVTTVLYPDHPNADAVQFLAFALQGNDKDAEKKLALLRNRMPDPVVLAFEEAMPHLLNWQRAFIVSTNGDFAQHYPAYQAYLKKYGQITRLFKVAQLLQRFGVKDSELRQTFAGWIPPTALTAMNSYLEIFDPSKLLPYGGDATLALMKDPKRLANIKAMLQKQPEGFIGFMYAFALDHLSQEYIFKILADPLSASPEMLTKYQSKAEEFADAYYQATQMPGHLIDTRAITLELTAVSYAFLCIPKVPIAKNPLWASRVRKAIEMRLQNSVPSIPTTYNTLIMSACAIEDYDLAYSISLKIPEFQTNAGSKSCWARIAYHRKDYGAAFDAAKAWLVQIEKGPDKWSIGEAKRIIQKSAELLKAEATRVEKLQLEETRRK